MTTQDTGPTGQTGECTWRRAGLTVLRRGPYRQVLG